MDIAPRTVRRIIKQDLGLGAIKRQTAQRLNFDLKMNWKKKSRHLLSLYGKERYNKILFSDEKIFTVEEIFNKQNDRVYARSSKEASELVPRIERGHFPTSVMV